MVGVFEFEVVVDDIVILVDEFLVFMVVVWFWDIGL